MGCLSIAVSVTLSIKFASTHLYSWVVEGIVRVKCLPQKHNARHSRNLSFHTAEHSVKEIWLSLLDHPYIKLLESKLACPRYEHNTVISDGRTSPSLQNVSATSVIFFASVLFSLLCEFFESDSRSVWVQKNMLFSTHCGTTFLQTR